METPEPVTYPKIVLDGKTYTVKFDNSAFIVASEFGLPIEELARKNEDGTPITRAGVESLKMALTLIAAGISHQAEFTPKQIGRMSGASTTADLPNLWAAINEALVKVAGRATAGTPAPEATPQLQ